MTGIYNWRPGRDARSPGWRSVAALALFVAALVTPASTAARVQESCPGRAGPDAEAGWVALGAGDLVEAQRRFQAALALCSDSDYARTGLGYVFLRQGEDDTAVGLFEAVVSRDAANTDALTGLGLIAWRRADLDQVRAYFLAVTAVLPDDATALDYLDRLPQGVGPPPERPPLQLPDTLVYPSRASGERFEIRTEGGWEPFYVKGVNLGAALPGRFPSEFPDSATYARWIRSMAEMNANMVRVYTIHPPDFYEALWEWNNAHPERPLWLVHGVWAEVPEDGDYRGADFEGEFFREMDRVVDVIHGRADIRPRPGHASGFYTSDLAPWTLAYIIGREWEPFSVMAFDSIRPDFRSFDGRYVTMAEGNPMEAWLALAVDHIAEYEAETYRAQRPVAYTNWPTLDPMAHPTETTRAEEIAIREALGEEIDFRPREYDNDIIGLDATRMVATDRFPAGVFASFHAYPYYPDFMVLQPSYSAAASSLGPSDYFGYLQDLKSHHPGMPVIVSEYGVPASLGPAHLQRQGQHHGGVDEEAMAEIDRRLTLELAEAGMAGGALFAWIDEWFKRNWLVTEFELPSERNRLWYNRLDAEQHYGMFAVEPPAAVEGSSLAARAEAWQEIPILARGDGGTIRAAADAAYLWLYVETPARQSGDRLHIGFDIIDRDAGDRRWPGAEGPTLPTGLEFVLIDDGEVVRIVADPPVNPFRLEPEGLGTGAARAPESPILDAPAGFRRDRLGQRFNLPLTPTANADGRYDSLWVVPNRRRIGRDSLEYRAMVYDRGVLRRGAPPDGLWERSDSAIEVRIPWLLINVSDPSSRSVLASPLSEAEGYGRMPDGRLRLPSGAAAPLDTLVGDLGVRPVEDIGILAALRHPDGQWSSWPSDGPEARFTWPLWERDEVRWRERPRPVYDRIRELYADLDPYAGVAAGATPPAGSVERAPAVPSTTPPALDSASGGSSTTTPPSGRPGPERVPADPAARSAAAAQAWADGDLELAMAAYDAVLGIDAGDGLALHRTGLMLAWEGRYDEAQTRLRALLDRYPENTEARVDQARVTAWSGDLEQALLLLDAVLDEEPGNAAALEARATFQAWAGRFDDALSSYDRLLSITTDPTSVLRQQAQVLSWASRFERSRAVYDSLLAADPGDVEARLGLARVLTFSGELDEAEREYGTVLAAEPDHIAALQGLGRVQSWDGRLIGGEETFRRARELDPQDVATLVGLAQNLRWQGRAVSAREVLLQAADLSPGDGDVREQLRWVNVALGPQLRPTMAVEDDSDDNHMVSTSIAAQWHPLPRLGVRADVYRRELSQLGLVRRAQGLSITGTWHFEPGWNVSGGIGGSRNDGTGTDRLTAWRVSIVSPSRHRANGSVRLVRSALDATAALANRGVLVTEAGVGAGWTPATGWRVDGVLSRTEFVGAEKNTRTAGSLSVSKRLGRHWTLGYAGRTFGFEKNLQEGYFDPDFYGIVEVNLRWLHEPGRWSMRVEGAPGVQKVGSAGSAAGAVRASARLAYNLAPGREVSLSGSYSSAGLQSFSTGDADYRYTALVFGATWVY